MKIAVTGGRGFIGSWLVKTFNEEYDFIVLGRKKSLNENKQDGIKYNYIATDYSKENLLNCLQGCDGVIHLAAKRVIAHDENLSDYINSNVIISNNLFEACKELDINNIVFLSSILAYSNENTLPWREDEDPKPTTYYGISKVISEKLANMYNQIYGMNIKSLRVAQVVGWEDVLRKDFVFMKFIHNAINKNALTVYGDGSGKREYVYVKDVVSAINDAIKSEQKSGIFNIGLGENISYKALAVLVNHIFENDKSIDYQKEKQEDKNEGLLDIQKAKEELGYSPKWPLEKALYDMKDTYMKHYTEGGCDEL